MACSSDINSEVFAKVTCEGDLLDPRFPAQLEHLLGRLNEKLENKVKVYKLEPWNSVRVTLSIPREAALLLRHLASDASQELRSLGILSVQVEGDQVISLGLAESVSSELQDIILDTTQDGSSNGGTNVREGTALQAPPNVSAQSTSSETTNTQMQFKSPNVVCPSDSVVPRVGTSTTTPSVVINANNKTFGGPFPFTSMNQAIHGGNREPGFNPLPPPYSGKHPPVTISSPLLVNLLQNDGTKESGNAKSSQQPVRIIRTPPATSQKVYSTSTSLVTTPSVSNSNRPLTTASDIVSNSVSPSALSSTTIKKHGSSILSTTNYKSTVKSPPQLPPQYNRGVAAPMVSQPMHASFVDSQPQSRTSLSQNVLSTPNFNSTQSMITQPAIQRQSVSDLQQFATPNLNRLSTTDTNVVTGTNSKLFQRNLSHGRTSPVKNFPIGRNTLSSMALPPRKIFNVPPSNSPTFLPTPMTSQAESLQNNDGNYLFQKLRTTKDSFMQPPSNNSNMSSQMMASEGTASSTATIIPNADTMNLNTPNLNNVLLRNMPSPPPYSVAISRTWDTPINTNSLLDLTPSLTDLKADELEDLLPTLELTESPLPDLSDHFLNVNSNMSSTEETKLSSTENRTFLINPLTGELEPQLSEESDHEEIQDVFTGLRSPPSLSDEDTCSISRFDTAADQSDSDARSNDKLPKLKNCSKDRGRDSPSLKQEKIKLRLKLEKSEPINPAYKVDVSYLNSHSKKATMGSSTSEELRVPPLHISLRGRNSVVIKNKRKCTSDDSVQKSKVKKNQEHSRMKKNDSAISISKSDEIFEGINSSLQITENPEQMKMKMHVVQKKIKKRTDQEQMEIITNMASDSELKPPFFGHNQIKEKQKERRGSDSELVRSNKKYTENSGVLFDDKKRRFSQTDQIEFDQPPVVGSTNVGTVASIPQKPRKDKMKVRDVFRKETTKIKNLYKIGTDKLQHKVVSLPVASDLNMEAKFKQGLMEGNVEKAVVKLPHRTDAETSRADNNVITTRTDIQEESIKEKMLDPDPDKCDPIETKSSVELIEKSNSVPGSRSPNTGGGQGEDSGIESMDALSEKSPNQASQSPYADIPKTQVPNILDIEAQLAKMEGLERDTYTNDEHSSNIPTEDLNENKCLHDASSKLNQCCELTYVLQESMSSPLESPNKQTETNFVPVKTEKEHEDLEPIPVRITPALYTYSNPEKGRMGLESPEDGISDDDSNSCSTTSTIHSKPSKSLLEQLLIEIPNDHQNITNSPSPATRFSVRTRALSKLESPELNSSGPKNNKIVPSGKRKRNESDSSNHSTEDNTKKSKRKTEAPRSDYQKVRYQNDPNKAGNNRKTAKDESSDSDEPLIEKMKKSNATVNIEVSNLVATKTKVKVELESIANNNNKGWMVNTRRSVRSNISTQISKNKADKIQSESDALRRKTRSTVIDVEKRKKEVK